MTEQYRVFAKCAWRLIPFMGLLYLANYIDRVNAGFAALTMNKDLHFSPTVFGFGAGVFFVGYLAFQVPASAVLERAGARRTVFWIMASWGAISAMTAFVQGAVSFYALRFLLGVAEAGFFPGMIFYLTLWFPRSYRTRFAAAFLCAIPLSGIVGGPLSALILEMDGVSGLRGWQWLFLLEGLPASLFALAVLKWLPDSPADAPWLNETEMNTIAAHLGLQTATATEQDLWSALRDPRVLVFSFAGFASGSSLYGTSLWLPQIVKGMGFSNVGTGAVVGLCYLASMAAMIVWGYSSDRRGDCIWHTALAWLLAAAGFLIASLAQNNAVTLAGLTLAVAGTLCAIGPYVMIVPTFLRGVAAAGGIALVNMIVSLGGFVGPVLIGLFRERSGAYASAMAMLAAELVLAALIVLALGRTMAPRPVKMAAATGTAE
jgi:ACS family tartrate transporter-like MFS transporter